MRTTKKKGVHSAAFLSSARKNYKPPMLTANIPLGAFR